MEKKFKASWLDLHPVGPIPVGGKGSSDLVMLDCFVSAGSLCVLACCAARLSDYGCWICMTWNLNSEMS